MFFLPGLSYSTFVEYTHVALLNNVLFIFITEYYFTLFIHSTTYEQQFFWIWGITNNTAQNILDMPFCVYLCTFLMGNYWVIEHQQIVYFSKMLIPLHTVCAQCVRGQGAPQLLSTWYCHSFQVYAIRLCTVTLDYGFHSIFLITNKVGYTFHVYWLSGSPLFRKDIFKCHAVF